MMGSIIKVGFIKERMREEERKENIEERVK